VGEGGRETGVGAIVVELGVTGTVVWMIEVNGTDLVVAAGVVCDDFNFKCVGVVETAVCGWTVVTGSMKYSYAWDLSSRRTKSVGY